MSSAQGRKRPRCNLERGYEVWRSQEQLMTAAYELLVPLVRRLVPAPPATADPRRGSAATPSPQPQAAEGGRSCG